MQSVISEGRNNVNSEIDNVHRGRNITGKSRGYRATKIVTLNIQGLLNRDKYKVDHLNDLAREMDPAVICIQETWLKANHTLTETKLQGNGEYRTIRLNRRG